MYYLVLFINKRNTIQNRVYKFGQGDDTFIHYTECRTLSCYKRHIYILSWYFPHQQMATITSFEEFDMTSVKTSSLLTAFTSKFTASDQIKINNSVSGLHGMNVHTVRVEYTIDTGERMQFINATFTKRHTDIRNPPN